MSCKAGAPSTYIVLCLSANSTHNSRVRCCAPSHQLDSNDEFRSRCHVHTEALIDAFSLQELWDGYGIVGDVTVCPFLQLVRIKLVIDLPQPFTAFFPRADIHELLTPDLLHQVIKGTFKDHLVTWVVDYIKQSNTAAQATKILADIDRRFVK